MAVPIAGVRFGHSTTRRRGGRRPPPSEDPAQTRHTLAGGFDNADPGSGLLARAAWAWLKQTDLIPDKGQFR